jgi:hypothetical protein
VAEHDVHPVGDPLRVFLDVTWEVRERDDGWWEAQSPLNPTPILARSPKKAVLLAQGYLLQRLGSHLERQSHQC